MSDARPPTVDSASVDRAYDLDGQVSVRPEPFGALCYHYGNRRLTFLASHDMVAVVRGLATAETLADALTAAGVSEARWPTFTRAIASLVFSGVLHERDADPRSPLPTRSPS